MFKRIIAVVLTAGLALTGTELHAQDGICMGAYLSGAGVLMPQTSEYNRVFGVQRASSKPDMGFGIRWMMVNEESFFLYRASVGINRWGFNLKLDPNGGVYQPPFAQPESSSIRLITGEFMAEFGIRPPLEGRIKPYLMGGYVPTLVFSIKESNTLPNGDIIREAFYGSEIQRFYNNLQGCIGTHVEINDNSFAFAEVYGRALDGASLNYIAGELPFSLGMRVGILYNFSN